MLNLLLLYINIAYKVFEKIDSINYFIVEKRPELMNPIKAEPRDPGAWSGELRLNCLIADKNAVTADKMR